MLEYDQNGQKWLMLEHIGLRRILVVAYLSNKV